MNSSYLPSFVPRFCVKCGGALIVTDAVRDLRRDGTQNQVRWRCSVCGGKSGLGWAQGGETAISPSVVAGAEIPDTIPVMAPLHHNQSSEFEEQDRLSAMVLEALDERGITAAPDLATFPVFIPVGLSRLVPHSFSVGTFGIQRGQLPRAGVGSLHVVYQGPNLTDPEESVVLTQMDVAERGPVTDEARAKRVVELIRSAARFGTARLQALQMEGGIYRTVNVDAVQKVPEFRVAVRLPPDIDMTWEERRLIDPEPFAYASTIYGNMQIEVAATGPIVDRLQSVYHSFTLVRSDSAALNELGNKLRDAAKQRTVGTDTG